MLESAPAVLAAVGGLISVIIIIRGDALVGAAILLVAIAVLVIVLA